MTCVYLGLGSNLGSAERQLRRAVAALKNLPDTGLIKVSPFYRNEAWGRKMQPQFTNAVVAISTRLPPQTLLAYCQKIEQSQGRLRKVKWGARTLDIDILLFGQRLINDQHLTIPHPRMLARDFVCLPLIAIAPQLKLPDGRRLADVTSFPSHLSFLKN